MSLTKEVRKDRLETGQLFPTARFADLIAAALHRQYGESHGAIKSVMRITGVAEKTVKNWFQAKNGPNGESLVELCRHSDQVLDTVLQLAGRDQQLKIKKLGELRAVAHQILRVLNEIEPPIGG